jgi:hypothetical protein
MENAEMTGSSPNPLEVGARGVHNDAPKTPPNPALQKMLAGLLGGAANSKLAPFQARLDAISAELGRIHATIQSKLVARESAYDDNKSLNMFQEKLVQAIDDYKEASNA